MDAMTINRLHSQSRPWIIMNPCGYTWEFAMELFMGSNWAMCFCLIRVKMVFRWLASVFKMQHNTAISSRVCGLYYHLLSCWNKLPNSLMLYPMKCFPINKLLNRTEIRSHLTCYLCPGTTRVVGAPLLTSATIFCHLWRSSAALWLLLKSRPVHSLMLSFRLFFCLPLFPGTVPCAVIFLQRPLDLTTCPNHRNFLFFHTCWYIIVRTDGCLYFIGTHCY